jgi:hypothetical protein
MIPPTLEQLLAYEFALEGGWKSVLDTADASLNAQIEFSDGQITYPLTTLQVRSARRTDHRHRHTDGLDYFDSWKGQFVFGFETVRGKNSDQQAAMIGKVRGIAQQAQALLTREVLPWHAFTLFSENSLQRGVDPETRVDRSELIFDSAWNIRTDVWALL